MALDAGVGLIVIENFRDIGRIEELADSPVDVLVRVRPNVGAATHTAMATATRKPMSAIWMVCQIASHVSGRKIRPQSEDSVLAAVGMELSASGPTLMSNCHSSSATTADTILGGIRTDLTVTTTPFINMYVI